MFKRALLGLSMVVAASLFAHTCVAATTIIHPNNNLLQDHYMVDLLTIATSYFPGKYKLQEMPELQTRARLKEMVATGDMDVMWTGSSKQVDQVLRPIHIPAYKGLMGHRVFIIRKGDQGRFDSVRSLEDLQAIKLGQGKSWSDTQILTNAGFNVVTSVKAAGLFDMLDGARFDAFPRGVQEPWGEIKSHPNLDLTVEKKLVLKYIMPYYFYVSKDRLGLAADIQEGLERSIADGSFDEHFYKDPEVKMALELSNLKDRLIFSIENPNASNNIPVDKPELWLDLSK